MAKLSKAERQKKKKKNQLKASNLKEQSLINTASKEELSVARKIMAGAKEQGVKLSLAKAISSLRQQRTSNDIEAEKNGFQRAGSVDGVAQFDRVLDKNKFKSLLEKRLEKRLESVSFEELTVGGSKLRFDMALAIDEYPFEIPEGEDEADYTPLLTNEQYMSGYYDSVIDNVFAEASKKWL